MKNRSSIIKATSIVFVFVIVPCCVVSFILLGPTVSTIIEQEQLDAQPLPRHIIEDFCENNLVPSELGTCQDGYLSLQNGDVLAILDHNIPIGTSKSDVHSMFGEFCRTCDTSGDSSYYRCWYDIPRQSRNSYMIYYDDESNNMVREVRKIGVGS